jgi:DNA-binding NarL/FixJ family response regulator
MRHRPCATAIVGPSALLREGLARILGTTNFRIIASGCQVQDVVSTSHHQPILLLIDAGDDPEAAVAQIVLFKEQQPSGRVAVLTDHYRLDDMVSAFRAGANLYFAKHVKCDALIKALELILLGETILPPELLALIGDRESKKNALTFDRRNCRDPSPMEGVEDVARLSVREKCILRCIVEGDSNKIIARKIEIAEATVKVHVKAILRKIRVHNRTQAAIWAMNNCASIWRADAGPPPIVAIPSPPSLAPDAEIESAQLPISPTPVNGTSTTAISINGVARKVVDRKHTNRAKTHDRTIGS